ncbi:lysozyme inhibitor LprI family protein [Oscillospiraceae bacterium OttesenSCG-928-F05]|nr:lysozyme inhibitor LprI family protein [Oscillospiraceae bacterium OttesenSCG-928-F05]
MKRLLPIALALSLGVNVLLAAAFAIGESAPQPTAPPELQYVFVTPGHLAPPTPTPYRGHPEPTQEPTRSPILYERFYIGNGLPTEFTLMIEANPIDNDPALDTYKYDPPKSVEIALMELDAWKAEMENAYGALLLKSTGEFRDYLVTAQENFEKYVEADMLSSSRMHQDTGLRYPMSPTYFSLALIYEQIDLYRDRTIDLLYFYDARNRDPDTHERVYEEYIFIYTPTEQ